VSRHGTVELLFDLGLFYFFLFFDVVFLLGSFVSGVVVASVGSSVVGCGVLKGLRAFLAVLGLGLIL